MVQPIFVMKKSQLVFQSAFNEECVSNIAGIKIHI